MSELSRWIVLVVLMFFLAEGFTLSVFPAEFKRVLAELEPRTLQVVGLVESCIACLLVAALWIG